MILVKACTQGLPWECGFHDIVNAIYYPNHFFYCYSSTIFKSDKTLVSMHLLKFTPWGVHAWDILCWLDISICAHVEEHAIHCDTSEAVYRGGIAMKMWILGYCECQVLTIQTISYTNNSSTKSLKADKMHYLPAIVQRNCCTIKIAEFAYECFIWGVLSFSTPGVHDQIDQLKFAKQILHLKPLGSIMRLLF